MVRVGLNQKNLYVELDEIGINRISVRPHKILTDPNGIFWIRYKQPLKSQYISASSVFEGNFDKSRFENKFVLIGASDFTNLAPPSSVPSFLNSEASSVTF